MSKSVFIRDLDRSDLPSIRSIVDGTGLFPPEMLGPMAEPFLAKREPHHWLVACLDERVAGFAYTEPERMTDGTFNLLAIAVDPAFQRRGIGRALVKGLMDRLRAQGGRVLIVETSALDGYAGTRSFYARQHFAEEGRIRDFYADGEDKILFWKHL